MSANANGTKPRILVADDQHEFATDMELLLGQHFSVKTCETTEQAIEIHREGWPDIVLLDIEFPAGNGLQALEAMQRHDTTIPVIMLTAHEDVGLVVEAMRGGAYDYISKAHDPMLLIEAVQSALRHAGVAKRCSYYKETLENALGIGSSLVLGNCAASHNLMEEIERAAKVDVGVLLLGETGTGKELVARLIHQKSSRGKGPFVPVEMSAQPETLLASSLFGHERGAFTGASERHVGAFEAAIGGSLLLDEVGNIPYEVQAKLLRILQDKIVYRLSGKPEFGVYCDVRVMAATNCNLEQLVKDEEFRKDLYHRLRILTIEVPPLRARLDDIPLLVDHFLQEFRMETDTRATRITPEALQLLIERPWPGNVRELENVIKAAMVRTRGTELRPADLQETSWGEGEPAEAEDVVPYHLARKLAFEAFKRHYLQCSLDAAGGVVNQAARLSSLPRSSFRKMMRDLGLGRNSG